MRVVQLRAVLLQKRKDVGMLRREVAGLHGELQHSFQIFRIHVLRDRGKLTRLLSGVQSVVVPSPIVLSLVSMGPWRSPKFLQTHPV